MTFVYSHEDLSQVKVSLISPTGQGWPLISGGTATGSTYYERTMLLNPAPIGELAGTWKLAVVDLAPETKGLVEHFKLSIVP